MDSELIFEILEKSLIVIGAGSTIATITPTQKDDKIFGWLYGIIHFIGMNFGKAKNKQAYPLRYYVSAGARG